MKRLVVCLVLSLSTAPIAAEEKPVRTYTNDDLARVSPYRDETGGTSPAAVAPPPSHAARPAPGRHDETYWRREAQRVQEQLRTLRHKAATLRLQIEDARQRALGGSRSGGRGAGRSAGRGRSSGSSQTSPESLQARLRLVESEIRERESALEDRARREGALPGWLR